MFLGYSYDEERRRLKHKGAKWWRVGDLLYYVVLLVAFFGVAMGLPAVVTALSGGSWSKGWR